MHSTLIAVLGVDWNIRCEMRSRTGRISGRCEEIVLDAAVFAQPLKLRCRGRQRIVDLGSSGFNRHDFLLVFWRGPAPELQLDHSTV